jgi:hypothetical protein
VSENPVASEIADAIRGLAAAVEKLAGVEAWRAVEQHSDTHGRQSEMAGLVLRFAHEGYFRVKIDGQKVCDADCETAIKMMDKAFKGKK